MAAREYQSFEAFFPYYLREHSDPGTRRLHYVGTALVIALAIGALVTGTWWLLVAIPLAGYGFAWVAHAFVERNKPATFTYPLWSLRGDFRMFFLFLTGRIDDHLRAAGVQNQGPMHTD